MGSFSRTLRRQRPGYGKAGPAPKGSKIRLKAGIIFYDQQGRLCFSRNGKQAKVIGKIADDVIVRRISRWRLLLKRGSEKSIVDLKRNLMRTVEDAVPDSERS